METNNISENRLRITVENCAKTYADGTQALRPTSLVVEPGEVMALLGPSGCGKTTLLRLVAGLEVPDVGGQLHFGDVNVTGLPVEQRGVGMVFQHYALFPQMSVAANIGYGLKVRGMPVVEQRRRVGEMVDLVRLQGLENKRPAELSGGQRQRVALARAVAVRPRVLLLDEPLTALDAKLKESLRTELAGLLRQLHITALHVTHDQQEALAIADRLAVMQAGQIVQVGRGEELYRTPAHPFVAEFLGRVNRIVRSPADQAAGCIRFGGITFACPPALQKYRYLLIRPENIGMGEPGPGRGLATVERRVFLGDRLELQLRVEGPDKGTLNTLITIFTSRDNPSQEGEKIGVWLQPAALMPGSEPL